MSKPEGSTAQAADVCFGFSWYGFSISISHHNILIAQI